MNLTLLFPRLAIFLIALFSIFVGYTAYLSRKYGSLNDKREEIIQAYRVFYTTYTADQYFSKRELSSWLQNYEQYKQTIEEYTYQVEKLVSLQNKIEFLKPLVTSYVNAFLLPNEYRNIIEYMHKLYNNVDAIIKERNNAYIEKEKKEYDTFFTNITGKILTEQQKLAIITDEANNLIVAGEVTEKTQTILGKTSFILEKKYAESEEMLILTVTEKARQELEARLQKQVNPQLQVLTFHGLANKILEIKTGKRPVLHYTANDETHLAITVEGFLLEHMNNYAFTDKLSKYFAYYPIPTEHKDNFKTKQEYEDYIQRKKPRTLQGELVPSMETLTIANYFYLHNVKYIYKHPYQFETGNQKYSQYNPDFFLPDQKIWIEHIDIDRECNSSSEISRDDYLDSWYLKRKIHQENQTELIETYSYQLEEGTLTDSLNEMLQVRGVRFEEIAQFKKYTALKDLGEVDQFIGLIIRFLRFYKSNELSIEDIEKKAKKLVMEKRDLAFLEIFKPILEDYEAMLKKTNSVDLDDVINTATQIIEPGNFQSKYKYIFLDEFQDISNNRYKLINAILSQNPTAKTFCIGDDRKSIQGCTGSEVSIMAEFDEYFYPNQQIYLTRHIDSTKL